MLTKISSFVLGFSFVCGLYYNNPSQEPKLKCTRCGNTYFTVSEKTTKFVGEGIDRVKKCGKFYKCTKCGILSDELESK